MRPPAALLRELLDLLTRTRGRGYSTTIAKAALNDAATVLVVSTQDKQDFPQGTEIDLRTMAEARAKMRKKGFKPVLPDNSLLLQASSEAIKDLDDLAARLLKLQSNLNEVRAQTPEEIERLHTQARLERRMWLEVQEFQVGARARFQKEIPRPRERASL